MSDCVLEIPFILDQSKRPLPASQHRFHRRGCQTSVLLRQRQQQGAADVDVQFANPSNADPGIAANGTAADTAADTAAAPAMKYWIFRCRGQRDEKRSPGHNYVDLAVQNITVIDAQNQKGCCMDEQE